MNDDILASGRVAVTTAAAVGLGAAATRHFTQTGMSLGMFDVALLMNSAGMVAMPEPFTTNLCLDRTRSDDRLRRCLQRQACPHPLDESGLVPSFEPNFTEPSAIAPERTS
ncbi:hypothetical protein [Sinorhizobium sp. BJ1]|uniref:hypothetical protein n=1 Tax=Sinorhizobium sp. BJ1 TaxID=2035455 RepID=UPI0006153C8D|nr:hypothetical protein [Sinorhizobium sp. BJ1]PDT82216.1 hypothetical protein CO676_18340 [Sinorhizobium sp. BJ1]